MGERKVIQVSQAAASNGYTLVALCDDGTMWHRDSLWSAKAEWRQVPQIPLPAPAPSDAAGETLTHFVIPADAGLDPIRVLCVDHEPGKGTLVVQCYNEAWTTYFGAMSGRSLLEFIASVDRYYLGSALRVKNSVYGERIANAVILAARERVAALTAARTRGAS